MQGQAGILEMLVDEPELSEGEKCTGVAVIAHPHPMFGGTMDNKVVQTLARAFVLAKWRAVRFNFRGVGQSQGVYDEGRGELQDLLDVIAHMAPPAFGYLYRVSESTDISPLLWVVIAPPPPLPPYLPVSAYLEWQ